MESGSYAASPNSSATNAAGPIESPLATHRTRPFRIMFHASIPCNVRHALTNEPYPCASQVRFFTVRWSCSTTLLRYLHWRRRTRRGSVPSSFRACTAGGKAGCLSTLMTRGTGLPGALRALPKRRLAAAASRWGGEQEIDRLAGGIDRPVQVAVLALDLHIGLVGAVALVG